MVLGCALDYIDTQLCLYKAIFLLPLFFFFLHRKYAALKSAGSLGATLASVDSPRQRCQTQIRSGTTFKT